MYFGQKENDVFLQSTVIKRMTPLLVSGVSGVYVLLRARRLSLAEPFTGTALQFLLDQSDLITVLAGVPVFWYVAQYREQAAFIVQDMLRGQKADAAHSLRQTLTVLLLGTELLARRAAKTEYTDLVQLARRLNRVVLQGITELRVLGEPYPADLEKLYAVRLPAPGHSA